VIAGGFSQAHAEDAPKSALVLALDYKLDLIDAARGGADTGARHLDALTFSADLDLDRAIGWRGASAHIDVLNTSGAAPNDLSASLQGVDNIEVGSRRLRLYQAWMEQSFAGDRAALRLGLYDVSGEFGVADAASLLLGPAFGFNPELAGSGPSGAAAYPSTALGARIVWRPTETSYLQAAVVNAQVGVPGEPGGVDTSFDQGELVIAEAGWTGHGKLALGAWAYSQRMDDQRAVDASGAPLRRRPHGAFAVIEQPVTATATAFLKGGLSEGDTQPLKSTWQAGLQVQPLFAARPDSALAFGISQVRLAKGYRANAADAGLDLDRAETLVELSYSDQLSPKIRLQPDLQYIHRPGGDHALKDAVVAGLRMEVAF
jgi:porin